MLTVMCFNFYSWNFSSTKLYLYGVCSAVQFTTSVVCNRSLLVCLSPSNRLVKITVVDDQDKTFLSNYPLMCLMQSTMLSTK